MMSWDQQRKQWRRRSLVIATPVLCIVLLAACSLPGGRFGAAASPTAAPQPLLLAAAVLPPAPDPLLLPEGLGVGNGRTPVQQPFVPGSLADLPADATACERVVVAALTAQGAPYSQGGYLAGDPVDAQGRFLPRNGPRSFDCSGMVWWAYQHANITLGWVAAQQAQNGAHIPCTLADLRGGETTCWRPGDLIFLDYEGRAAGDHVAMYVGNGLFMDCLNHDDDCVLHDISNAPWYRQHFWQARRIISDCAQGTVATGPATPLSPTPAGSASPAPSVDRPTLRRGDEGDAVRELQQLLNQWVTTVPDAGLEPLAENGVFGETTETVVRMFQYFQTLTADGVVGPDTWEALLAQQPAATPSDPAVPSDEPQPKDDQPSPDLGVGGQPNTNSMNEQAPDEIETALPGDGMASPSPTPTAASEYVEPNVIVPYLPQQIEPLPSASDSSTAP